MPRFQSNLFNWIDRSLPVQLGRSVRAFIEDFLDRRIGNPPSRLRSPQPALPFQVGRKIGKQIARMVLYPVYVLGTVLKRNYPQLNPQANSLAQPQLNPQTAIPQTESQTPSSDPPASPTSKPAIKSPSLESLSSKKVPFLFRPVQSLFLWVFPSRQVKLKSTEPLELGGTPDRPQLPPSQRVPFLLLPFQKFGLWISPPIPKIDDSQVKTNPTKPQPTSPRVLPTKKVPLLLRPFQKIVLWISPPTDLEVIRELVDKFESPDFIEGEVIEEFQPKVLSDRPIPLLLRPFVKIVLWVDGTKLFRDSAQDSMTESGVNPVTNTDTPKGNSQRDRISNRSEAENRRFLEIWRQRFQSINLATDADGNLIGNQALGKNEQLERVRDLLRAAIAYFFGKKVNPLESDQSSGNLETSSEEAWLTMADLFGDENGPWPLSFEYESMALARPSDSFAVDDTKTVLASTKRDVDGNLVQIVDPFSNGEIILDDPNYLPDWSEYLEEPTPPLRAWIETHATFLGYAYSPIMEVVHWLDRLIARLERSLLWLWRQTKRLPQNLSQKFKR
jgi:hypothetical protein